MRYTGQTAKTTDAPGCAWRDTLQVMVTEAASDWFTRARRDPSVRYYLTFTPTDGETWGKLHVISEVEPTEGRDIVVRFSNAWDVEKAQHEVRKAVRRLPLIPADA